MHLAIQLDFNDTEIKVIKANHSEVDGQCYAMLSKHFLANGSIFTKQVLIDALLKANLQEIAEKIMSVENCNHDNYKERKNNNLQNRNLFGKKYSLWIVMESHLIY